jgi:DNA-binding beta-propeller fold protein YncE
MSLVEAKVMETNVKIGFMARIAMFVIGSLFVALGATTARADAWGKVYWTDTGNDNIRRANLDGSNAEVLVTGVDWPMGLALDPVGGKMYWTNGISVNKISRANLDGTGVEDLLTGMADPRGIALDVAAGKMYFSSEDNDLIRRANLDGTGIETILSDVPFCTHLDLDLTAGKIYWTDIHTGFGDGTISRANLDGTGRETLLAAPGAPGNWFYPVGIELDVAAGKMYWADSQEDLICRANLDGSGLEEFSLRPPADPSPTDLALDLVAGKIYWTNMVDNKGVWRANMDLSLSNRESIVSTGMYYPSAIEVIPVPEPGGIHVTPLAHHPDLMLDPPTPNPVTGTYTTCADGVWHGSQAFRLLTESSGSPSGFRSGCRPAPTSPYCGRAQRVSLGRSSSPISGRHWRAASPRSPATKRRDGAQPRSP